MEKKIEALKAAYQSGDRTALVKAARSLVAHDRKHPMAIVCCGNPDTFEIVNLARKIAKA